jgi:hypothetical protein
LPCCLERAGAQRIPEIQVVQPALNPEKLPHRRATAEQGQFTYSPPMAADLTVSSEQPEAIREGESGQYQYSEGELAESTDVQLTPGIRALAESLGGDPTQIFKWVRSNITFTPTFGSVQGSEGCRLSRECNAHDTSSLLIALLRVSKIPARYALGVVSVNPEFFKSALGDFTDLNAAGSFAASSGTPIVFVIDDSQNIIAVRLAHAWVEAYVTHPRTGERVWVSLDAALKRTRFRSPANNESNFLSADSFDAILKAATSDPNGDSIVGINNAAIENEVQGLQDRLQQLIARRNTVGQITGFLEPAGGPVRHVLSNRAFPGTLVQVANVTAELPPSLRHQLTLQITDLITGQGISGPLPLPELANKRLTISYLPATQQDVDFVMSNGGLYSAPPNLFNVRVVVNLDGQVIGVGPPVQMGALQNIRITFAEPSGFSDFVDHFIAAGTYAVVGLNLQRASSEGLQARRNRITATLDQLRAASAVNFDEILGEILHSQAQIYYALLDVHTRLSANQLNVVFGRRPAEMLMTFAPVFSFDQNGVPTETRGGSMSMDFRRNILSLSSRTDDAQDEGSFLFGTGAYSSALEHSIFEITQDTRSISTLRLLVEANNQNIPIFTISAQNVARVLPQLTLPDFVLQDIRDSVASGKIVITHRDIVQFLQWVGVGYIVLDPASGAAGYFITGGIAGKSGQAGGATALIDDFLLRFQGFEAGFLKFDPFTGNTFFVCPPGGDCNGATNTTSVEGLILNISHEVEITEQQTTVFEGRGRAIQTLSACQQATLANAEGGAVVNNVLWNDIFGSPLGVPSAKTNVPSLSAFVFDFFQDKLRQLREEGITCQ